MKFTHLHVHTQYSLLDGLPKIDQLINHAKENNMDSVAITDHGVLYGAVEFYKKYGEIWATPRLDQKLPQGIADVSLVMIEENPNVGRVQCPRRLTPFRIPIGISYTR